MKIAKATYQNQTGNLKIIQHLVPNDAKLNQYCSNFQWKVWLINCYRGNVAYYLGRNIGYFVKLCIESQENRPVVNK